MDTQTQQRDTPTEIIGYVTDPKWVGYQILTNYESTYWRRLVGRDAWSLYEVLRSFCHEGRSTAHPSINTLIDILDLSDRRELTGRITKVKGQEYRYPGLIEILQAHNLIVAEVAGEGAFLRYLFHVNMTPGLLKAEQVATLPDSLQEKHAALVQRCENEIRSLEAKRRAPKVPLTPTSAAEGSGKLPEGGWQFARGGGGNLPDKQYQQNNTQNNSSGGSTADVAAFLERFGIDKEAAQRLIAHYSSKRIREKIEYLEYLLKTNPAEVKNPGGWLRRAIENDYKAPPGFKPKVIRQAEEAEKAKRFEEIEQAIASQDPQRPSWRDWIIEDKQLPPELAELTDKLIQQLRDVLPESTLHTWARQAMLSKLGQDTAELSVPSETARLELARHKQLFSETLSGILNRHIGVDLIVVKRPLD